MRGASTASSGTAAASRSVRARIAGAPPQGLDPNSRLVRFAHVDFDFIERPSPNFDERQLPVSMIVLHYTGMPDMQSALDRLTSPEAKVSSHYLVDEDGTIYRLVDESRSEERRVGKECRSRWSPRHYKKKKSDDKESGK